MTSTKTGFYLKLGNFSRDTHTTILYTIIGQMVNDDIFSKNTFYVKMRRLLLFLDSLWSWHAVPRNARFDAQRTSTNIGCHAKRRNCPATKQFESKVGNFTFFFQKMTNSNRGKWIRVLLIFVSGQGLAVGHTATDKL